MYAKITTLFFSLLLPENSLAMQEVYTVHLASHYIIYKHTKHKIKSAILLLTIKYVDKHARINIRRVELHRTSY